MTLPEPAPCPPDVLVTLTVVRTLAEADLVCTNLAADGIRTFLPDQTTVWANPMYGGAIGGIRIQVPSKDIRRAKELLAAFHGIRPQSELLCPRCGAEFAAPVPPPPWFSVLCVLLLALPLLWVKRTLRCARCGTQWKLP